MMQSAGGGGAAPSVATTALHAAGSILCVFGAEATGAARMRSGFPILVFNSAALLSGV